MSKPTFEIEGRSTGSGAFTDAVIIRPDGSEYEPDHKESSRTGNHWTSWWYDSLDDCLILVTDISNSGKDRSYIQQSPDPPTPQQVAALKHFTAEHWLD